MVVRRFESFLSFCSVGIQLFMAALIAFVLLILLAFQIWLSIPTWPLAFAIFGLATFWFWAIYICRNEFHTYINERDIGIVFKRNGDFDDFVDCGERYILPRSRVLETHLRVKNNKAEGETKMRTLEGVLVTIYWETKYSLKKEVLLNGSNEQKREWAYALMKSPYGKVAAITIGALRKEIEKRTTADLFYLQKKEDERQEEMPEDDDRGLLGELENIVTSSVQSFLKLDEEDCILTEDSGKVTIKFIELPPRIENAIEENYQLMLYKAKGHPYRLEAIPHQFRS